MRRADDEGVQRDGHDTGVLLALGVEHVEGVDDALVEVLDADRGRVEQRHVVEFDRVGDRAEAVAHAVGQIVIDPVADIFGAGLGEQREGAPGFGKAGAEPAAHALAQRLDGVLGLEDGVAFLLLGLPGHDHRVGQAVAHELPAELLGFLEDFRVVLGDLGIERDTAADAVFRHHLHHAPDADTVAVVAAGVVADVRRAGEEVEVEVLDVGDHPDGDAGAVRPGDFRPVDDGLVGEEVGGLERLGHGSLPWVDA